jgi:hypothetical protein
MLAELYFRLLYFIRPNQLIYRIFLIAIVSSFSRYVFLIPTHFLVFRFSLRIILTTALFLCYDYSKFPTNEPQAFLTFSSDQKILNYHHL